MNSSVPRSAGGIVGSELEVNYHLARQSSRCSRETRIDDNVSTKLSGRSLLNLGLRETSADRRQLSNRARPLLSDGMSLISAGLSPCTAEVAGSSPVVPPQNLRKKRFYGEWRNHEPPLTVLTRALERSAPSLVFEFAPFEGVESFFFPASSTIVMTLLLG